MNLYTKFPLYGQQSYITKLPQKTICSYFPHSLSANKKASIVSYSMPGNNKTGYNISHFRGIVLDHITNIQECMIDRNEERECSCKFCNCRPIYNLDDYKHGSSTYVSQLCYYMKVYRKCAFNNGVVIGLGIGSLSGCLATHCPNIDFMTVDVDPTAVRVSRDFFGYRSTNIAVLDATEYMRSVKYKTLDFVIVDCSAQHMIPASCRSKQLLQYSHRVLNNTKGTFAINTISMPSVINEYYVGPLSKYMSDMKYEIWGQWLIFKRL